MRGGQLYQTAVVHSRPRLSPYRFRYRLFHLLLDVDQLPATSRRLRLFSYNRANLLSFHDRDFGPGDGTAPRAWLAPLLQQHGQHFDLSRIEVLCMPRVLGRAFNPLTVWYCRDARDALRAVICEVHNTFGERHSYVLGTDGDALAEREVHRAPKRFFVSPFLPLAGAYEFRLRLPGERIGVQIDYRVAGMSLLHASLQGAAAPLNDWQLARALARMPLQTLRVVAGIHRQALRLWWRGAPMFDRLEMQEVEAMTAPDIQGVPDMATSSILPGWLAMRIRQAAVGRLTLRDGHGRAQQFSGDTPGPHADVLLHRRRAIRRMMLGGDIGLLEAYMDGDWDTPDLAAVLTWGLRNEQALGGALQASFALRQLNRLLHRRRANTHRGSRRNIAAHYDIGNAFYRLWLDPSMTYSCGIYSQSQTTLAQAQLEKYERMLDLLKLEPDHHLLEIGSGWGGFAIHAAQRTGCRVTSITLSREQLAEAQTRAEAAGVADRVQFIYRDYRDEIGTYDRIVSIEMFEAVGEQFWDTYFSQLRRCLRPGGRAALQVITIDEASFPAYRQGADFIQHYIFPGGMLPSPSAFAEAAAAAGLRTGECNFYGPHYDRTLGDWDRAIVTHAEALTALGLDDRFQRMWRAYLAYCQAGFRTGRLDLMQTVLTAA